MIITLKGANFSASNIGQLNSWFVTYNLTGAEKQSGPISIDKDNNTGMTATIKVYDNYDFQSASAVYNGKTVTYTANSSGIVTINITEKITTAVTITVLATNTGGGGGDEPDVPEETEIVYKYDEQDLQEGYVKADGTIDAPSDHQHFILAATGIESITFIAKCKGIADIPYFVHKAANGTITPYANIADYTAGQSVTITFPENLDGDIYVNHFAPAEWQGTLYEYHTEITVKYKNTQPVEPEPTPEGAMTIKYSEQNLQPGYVLSSGEISSSSTHQYFTLNAEGIKSITFTTKCTVNTGLYYFVHKAANGTVTPYASLSQYAPGQTNTITLPDNIDGIIYVNVYAPTTINDIYYDYPTEIIVQYN